MIRCVIVDDEPLAVRLLRSYIGQVTDLELVSSGSDVFAALNLAQNKEVDLVFLDIQMPELTGIQFLRVLNRRCPVILTTAYEAYALQGYEFDVVDYLLKPFSFSRFSDAVAKARVKAGSLLPAPPEAHIFVRSEYRMIRLNLKDILYLESLRDYVAIHTVSGKVLTLQSLRSFEESLPPDQFMRVHKSYLVALQRIEAVEKKALVIGRLSLPIGDAYSEKFRKKILGG